MASLAAALGAAGLGTNSMLKTDASAPMSVTGGAFEGGII